MGFDNYRIFKTGVLEENFLAYNKFEQDWLKKIAEIYNTRPKPVEHDYVFSVAVGTIGAWLKLVPFFVR